MLSFIYDLLSTTIRTQSAPGKFHYCYENNVSSVLFCYSETDDKDMFCEYISMCF